MLERFLKNSYDLLKPGGKLVGLNANMYCKPEEFKFLEKYNRFVSSENEHLQEGDKIHIMVKQDDQPDMSIFVYHLKPDTYERVFKRVGFQDFKWIPWILSADVEDKEYW